MDLYTTSKYAFLLGQGNEQDDLGSTDKNMTDITTQEPEVSVTIIDNRIDPLTAVHNYG